MNELLAYLGAALVGDAGQVSVREEVLEEGVLLELRVPQESLGRVIGRGGRTARALRTVVRAAAVREGRRVSIEIVGV